MNSLLSAYYGTTRQKVSAPTGSAEIYALKELDDFVAAGTIGDRFESLPEGRLSSLVEQLGGPKQARDKLSSERTWLTAWRQGEKDGVALAVHAMRVSLLQARSATDGPLLSH